MLSQNLNEFKIWVSLVKEFKPFLDRSKGEINLEDFISTYEQLRTRNTTPDQLNKYQLIKRQFASDTVPETLILPILLQLCRDAVVDESIFESRVTLLSRIRRRLSGASLKNRSKIFSTAWHLSTLETCQINPEKSGFLDLAVSVDRIYPELVDEIISLTWQTTNANLICSPRKAGSNV